MLPETTFVFLNLLTVYCAQASEDFGEKTFKTKYEHIMSNPDDYHLVRPYRSTPEGDFLTHELSTEYEEDRVQFHRVRRQAESSRRNDNEAVAHDPNEADDESENVFHFSMNVFGKNMTINVTRETHLVSPSFKVNRYLSDGSVIVERPRVNCFYRGHVIGSERSAVAISNCRGMSGLIRTNEDEYFIEPLETDEPQTTTYNYTDGLVHIMYRRRDARMGETGGVTDLHDDVERVSAQLGRRASHYPRSNHSVHSRQSRQAADTSERRHYVETMITLDYSVHSFHGTENVNLYVLTMMNIVNMIYRDPSLDAHIEFIITRANLLNEKKSSKLMVYNNPVASLENSCDFAYEQRTVKVDDGSDDYFDHAIYLTRTYFEGVDGRAYGRHICWPLRSCSLVKDVGIYSAILTVHAAGFALGLMPDGKENECLDSARFILNGFWSNCSRNQLHAHLPSYTCLWDYPTAGTRATNNTRPGRTYSLDQQCQFQFGKEYRDCYSRFRNVCYMLECTGPGVERTCVWKYPALEGTSCGFEKECVNEVCVSTRPVDGGWSEWGPWDHCTYSCEVGVQARRRSCDNPVPDGGGQDCVGSSKEYRLCNTQVCPDGPADKQQDQCNEHGDLVDESFLAYQNTDPEATCKLSCEQTSSGELYVSDGYVRDGTPASYDYPEVICIGGKPYTIGCDNELGSTKFLDNCGVCGGQNDSCVEIVTDIVEDRAKANKYKKLMTLSPGMWNLKVTKRVDSPHYLALKIEGTGRYILNKGRSQSPSHAFIESGVRFVYTTDGENEILAARGPIPETLYLMAYVTKDRRPIDYHVVHYVSSDLEDAVTPSPVPDGYTWQDMGWTSCNRDCGGGYSFHRFQCLRNSDNKRVKYRLCGQSNSNPKGDKRSCNEDPCPSVPVTSRYEWRVVADWGECSVTCGQSASRTRAVECVQVLNAVQTPTDSEMCLSEERPHDTETCGLAPCPSSWNKGAWSSCSVTCGSGVKSRDVTCNVPDGALSEDYECPIFSKPPATKTCQLEECPAETGCTPRDRDLCDPPRLSLCNLPGYSETCCMTCGDILFGMMSGFIDANP